MPSSPRAFAAVALAALCASACSLHGSARSPSAGVLRAHAIGAALRVDGVTEELRYAMDVGGEAWDLDVVTGPRAFAERRTRRGDASATHVLGVAEAGAFARAAERAPVWIDGGLGEEAHTRAALFGAGFARPRAGDTAEIESAGDARYSLVFRPAGGSSLWLTVDRASAIPLAFDVVSSDDRPLRCDSLEWDDRPGARRVLARASCSGFVSHVGRHTITLALTSRRAVGAAPAWAAPPSGPASRAVAAPFSVPIESPDRVYLPATVGAQTAKFVVDTGAAMTTVTEREAKRLGVVRLPERPRHVRPPWLAEDTMWVGMIDELRFGEHVVRGQRVYVMRDDGGVGDAAGLLGVDVLAKMVVDVDSPRRTLVLHGRDAFDASDAESLWVKGLSHGSVSVRGEVDGVAEGDLVLDTGAPIDVVVHHVAMATAHPRKRGQDVGMTWGEVEISPDYAAEIDGLTLGPFHFPAMPAIGRDRQRERVGGGVALVGMGLMRHFRMAFDLGRQLVHVWPGDSYLTLDRAGVEVDERDGVAVLTRVAPKSVSAAAGLRAGDIVRSVNGKPMRSAPEVVGAIARSQREARVTVERNGRPLARPLALR